MLSNLSKLPLKLLLESGDCTHPRFAPDFGKEFFLNEPLDGQSDSQSETLHPINRWLRWLDPDMWDISPQEKDLPCKETKPLPVIALKRVINYLRPFHLKSLRLVCKQWNGLITSSRKWQNETVAVINPSRSTWLELIYPGGIGFSCAAYLDSSHIRFSHWLTLRLDNVSCPHLTPLLTFKASLFRRSVKHISKLELASCHLTWSDFFELIHLFQNLECLEMNRCHLTLTQESLTGQLLYSLGMKAGADFQEILDQVGEKCPASDYFFGSLKSLCIWEEEDGSQSDRMTSVLLMLLKSRTGEGIQEFRLELGRTSANLRESEEQSYFWQAVHSFLACKNVQKCCISSRHNVSCGMVNRFFMHLNLWNQPRLDGSKTHPHLSEFSVNLRPLILWNSFQRHLIPLLQRLSNLNSFSLHNVVLRGNKAHFIRDLLQSLQLHQVQPDSQLSPGLLVKIGIIIDDQGGSAPLVKEILTSSLYQKHLVAVEVIVHTDAIRELRDMFPHKKENQYRNVDKFTFSTNGATRPRFFTFNVNSVVHNFPNLTELGIIDGPCFEYNSLFIRRFVAVEGQQWKDMSSAVLGDEDFQLIFRNLVNLKKLIVRANMKYVSDSGFTGIPPAQCKRILKKAADPEANRSFRIGTSGSSGVTSALSTIAELGSVVYRSGRSFANLTKLEHIVIEGIGDKVTDITAFLAFDGLEKVDSITLFGSHQISGKGKEHLCKYFRRSNTVAIN